MTYDKSQCSEELRDLVCLIVWDITIPYPISGIGIEAASGPELGAPSSLQRKIWEGVSMILDMR